MFDLSGRRALVTGASGGIGAAIARALHGAGATVALSGTRREALEALAAELGERAPVCPADLSDSASVEALVPAAAAALGGDVEILVNNAGITRDQLMMRMKDEDWSEVLRVDLDSVFRLSRAVVRGMMKARFGRIVHISSVVAAMGNAGQVNYGAAKAGMIGLAKSLACEVATRGITVNTVSPGFIATPMTDALPEARKEHLLLGVPANRLGTAEEVAAGVVFLASDEASYVTGHTLHINGGMYMA